MSGTRAPLSCPACGADTPLELLFAHQEDRDAVHALIDQSIPIGAQLLRYVGLFAPSSNRLSLSRKLKLISELLPDLQRGRIHRKGREWGATPASWLTAIDQMLAQQASGRLTLPLTNHGYLYEILAGMADKAEAAAERYCEQERAITQVPPKGTVTVRGETMSIGQGLAQVFGGRDPTLAKLEAEAGQAVPPSAEVRERLNQLKKGR